MAEQYTPEQVATLRRAQEIVHGANRVHGLQGDQALTLNTKGLEWATEDAFEKSVHQVAADRVVASAVRRRSSEDNEDSMATKKTGPTGDLSLLHQSGRQRTERAINEAIAKGGGMAARPPAPRGKGQEVPPSEIVRGYSSAEGPRAKIDALKKQAEAQSKRFGVR